MYKLGNMGYTDHMMMNETKRFPTAIGTPTDIQSLEDWHARAKELDAKGQFDQAKSYYNGCMSLILSKRITFPKVES